MFGGEVLRFEVVGVPRPQGSLQPFRASSGRLGVRHGVGLLEWRGVVAAAARDAVVGAGCGVLDGGLWCVCEFRFVRPRSVSGLWKVSSPDLDKLVRGVWDGCTAGGVWVDDSRVVLSCERKVYGESAGVLVRVGRVL